MARSKEEKKSAALRKIAELQKSGKLTVKNLTPEEIATKYPKTSLVAKYEKAQKLEADAKAEDLNEQIDEPETPNPDWVSEWEDAQKHPNDAHPLSALKSIMTLREWIETNKILEQESSAEVD